MNRKKESQNRKTLNLSIRQAHGERPSMGVVCPAMSNQLPSDQQGVKNGSRKEEHATIFLTSAKDRKEKTIPISEKDYRSSKTYLKGAATLAREMSKATWGSGQRRAAVNLHKEEESYRCYLLNPLKRIRELASRPLIGSDIREERGKKDILNPLWG